MQTLYDLLATYPMIAGIIIGVLSVLVAPLAIVVFVKGSEIVDDVVYGIRPVDEVPGRKKDDSSMTR